MSEGKDAQAEKKDKGKKLIVMIAGVLVVILAGGTTTYFLGYLAPILGSKPGKQLAELSLGSPTTHELPRFKADLKTGRCRAPSLRTVIVISLNSQHLSALQESETKVLDQVQMHLRDQERQDLVGKAGTDNLRFDIANIINNIIAPAQISTVLFKEFLLK